MEVHPQIVKDGWFIFRTKKECVEYTIQEGGLWEEPVELDNNLWKMRKYNV